MKLFIVKDPGIFIQMNNSFVVKEIGENNIYAL